VKISQLAKDKQGHGRGEEGIFVSRTAHRVYPSSSLIIHARGTTSAVVDSGLRHFALRAPRSGVAGVLNST